MGFVVTIGIVVVGLVGIVVGGTVVVVGIVVRGNVIVPVVAEEDSVGTVAEDWEGMVGVEVPLVSGTDVGGMVAPGVDAVVSVFTVEAVIPGTVVDVVGMVLGRVGVSDGEGSLGSVCEGSVSSGGANRISSTINFSTSSLYIKKGNSSTVFSA